MRIKFKKIIRSTNIETSAILKRIIDELNEAGYKITNQTQSKVEFKYNIWGPGSRTDVYRKVDGGTIDIIPDNKSIVFSYYLTPIFEIVLVCIVAFFGIIKDHRIFFFILLIAFAFMIRLISVKMVGDQMTENILNLE